MRRARGRAEQRHGVQVLSPTEQAALRERLGPRVEAVVCRMPSGWLLAWCPQRGTHATAATQRLALLRLRGQVYDALRAGAAGSPAPVRVAGRAALEAAALSTVPVARRERWATGVLVARAALLGPSVAGGAACAAAVSAHPRPRPAPVIGGRRVSASGRGRPAGRAAAALARVRDAEQGDGDVRGGRGHGDRLRLKAAVDGQGDGVLAVGRAAGPLAVAGVQRLDGRLRRLSARADEGRGPGVDASKHALA